VSISYVFAGIAAADYDSLREWYQRLIGRPPDLIPNETEVCWQLTDTGWIYVVADPDRAGNAFLTVLVDDLDHHLAGLADRGIASGPIDTLPGGVRKAVVTDPEGNTIQFGEAPKS
jgi:predicted enzyme related to lactoylglutathione lyase